MSKPESALRILLIEDAVEDAEHLISVLRNAGLAVRPSRAEDPDQLAGVLERQPIDLVLVNMTAKSVSLKTAAAAVNDSGKDISVIAITNQPTTDALMEAFRQGARDVAFRMISDHVQLVVKREFENLNARRAARRMETALRESERRCNALLDSSRDPIAYVHEGMHVYANKAYLEMMGFEEFDEIEGTPILDMIAGDDATTFKDILKGISKGDKPPKSLDLKARKADGASFPATMEFSEASIEGEPCTQIVFRQQAVNPELAKEVESLRSQDLVTGLMNRQYFLTELDRFVGESMKGARNHSLMLLEIDNFKPVLDSIGIGGMDLLLSDVGSVLKRHLTEDDIPARFSENVFTVLCPKRGHDDVKVFAEKLRKGFEGKIFEIGKQSINLTVTIALVLVGERSGNATQVLEHATITARQAQAEGGNRLAIFDPMAKDKEDEAKHKHWIHLVQDSLKNNNFVLFYQPIISLHGAEGEYFEILLRMHTPKGEVLPGMFLPSADRAGLLPQIDRWVISHAIKALADREKAGHKTVFFIKITPQAIEDPTLLPWLAQQLKTYRLRGDALVFEMPESKVVTNLKPARAFQKGLEQLHCHFALEQFGSGLNSFQLLKHLDAQYLKIDRNYMAGLAKSQESQNRVKELCEQAHHAGKLTVAEFVEDAASMSILFSAGVNFVQGNFLQEPEKVMAHGGM